MSDNLLHQHLYVHQSLQRWHQPNGWRPSIFFIWLADSLLTFCPDKAARGNVKQCQFICWGAWAIPGNIIVTSLFPLKRQNPKYKQNSWTGSCCSSREVGGENAWEKIPSVQTLAQSQHVCHTLALIWSHICLHFMKFLPLSRLWSPPYSSNLTQMLHYFFVQLLLVLHKVQSFLAAPCCWRHFVKVYNLKNKSKGLCTSWTVIKKVQHAIIQQNLSSRGPLLCSSEFSEFPVWYCPPGHTAEDKMMSIPL